MIQELFSGVIEPSSNSPSHSSSTTNTTTTTTAVPNATTSDNQKLRCPRCDSSQTKFCYYNNYNLTQPRHFCKTCRRYWTKGGALRNVPIGGGCRKNKGTTITAAIGKSISSSGKLRSVVSSELGKSSFMNNFELENNNRNQIMWSAPPQTSHLLSLFRATQNPNPSFTSNPLITHMKDQGFMGGSNMGGLGFESLGQTSTLGLCSSLWSVNNQENDHHQNQRQEQGIMTSSGGHQAVQNNTENYYHHHQTAAVPLILGSNAANTCSASTSTTILDSAPVVLGSGGGEMGFWSQTLPWSDLAAANGAYH